MLRESLRVMRERGQSVSGLYTPHPAFYRRYGWEVASEGRTYTFKPKDLRLQVQPRVRGRLRSLKAEDWQALDRVYRGYSARRNGPLHRGEVWWRNAVLREADQPPPDVVAWEGESGEAEGYVVYGQPREGREAGKVVVHELVATGADAYLNLLAFLGNHDVHEEVSLRASPEEPFLNLMADPDRLQARFGYAVLLRVCDFEAAMNARPPVEGAQDVDVNVEVSDPVAPWNEGIWRTGIAEGRTFAERATGEAELRLAAGVLGPLFNGFLAPSTAAASGLAWLRDAGTARRADALFAVEHRPFFPDFF
jgi:predicted acetyltransferase